MKRKQLSRRPKPWRAVGVARVSGEGQRDNTSHDIQEAAISRFCDAEGMDLIEMFYEVASGTGYETRVQTQAALEMIDRDEADVLVMYDVSRYGRDQEYQHKILKRIIAAGGRLQFALFRLEYDDRTGELTPESLQMVSFMGVGAAAELAYIRRRMTNGIERKRDEGLQMSRTIHPFGWHIVTKADVLRGDYAASQIGRYEPTEQLRHVKSLVFDSYSAGLSLRDICTQLEEQGILPPRQGDKWAPSSVREILRNPLYMGRPARRRTYSKRNGKLTPKGKPSVEIENIPSDELEYLKAPWLDEHFARPDIAPYLVPASLYWQCHAALESNRTRLSGAKKHRTALSGLLFCPLCGTHMMSKLNFTTRDSVIVPGLTTYVCAARNKSYFRDVERCLLPSLYSSELLENVLIALKWFAYDPRVIEVLCKRQNTKSKSSDDDDGIAKLGERLQSIEAEELEAVTDRIAARRDGQSVAVYDILLARLNTERDALILKRQKVQSLPSNQDIRTELANIRTQLIDVLDTLRQKETQGALRNQILRLLVNRIEPILKPGFVPYQGFRLSPKNSPLYGVKLYLASSPPITINVEDGRVSCSTV